MSAGGHGEAQHPERASGSPVVPYPGAVQAPPATEPAEQGAALEPAPTPPAVYMTGQGPQPATPVGAEVEEQVPAPSRSEPAAVEAAGSGMQGAATETLFLPTPPTAPGPPLPPPSATPRVALPVLEENVALATAAAGKAAVAEEAARTVETAVEVLAPTVTTTTATTAATAPTAPAATATSASSLNPGSRLLRTQTLAVYRPAPWSSTSLPGPRGALLVLRGLAGEWVWWQCF